VKQFWSEWKQESNIKKAADILGLCIVFAGIAISIFMNRVGRSLWLDEAMLAYSFSKRSIWELTGSIFEWEQSAPVLYLYMVKLLTIIFGNTEFVLRSFSVLCYAIVLFLSGYVAKKLFYIKYPILVAAFLANMNFMLNYSNQFKQYMSECIWVLLVLLVYYFYKEKGLAWWKMALAFMVFIWGANPACFFIGGILIYEFICGILKMGAFVRTQTSPDKVSEGRLLIRNSIFTGIGVAVSFIGYFFYWLRGTATSSAMQDYWQNADFPLIPKNLEDIKLAKAFLYEIFITFREARVFMVALVLVALIIGIFWEKNKYCTVIALGFFVALFASYIHMFPIADRLWCFSYPIFTILAFYAVNQMAAGSKKAELAALFLMFTLMLTNNGILVYRHAENVYWTGEEANASIDYVQEHIRDDEKVYVYYHSIPVVKYKIGYEAERIGDVATNNIMWGTDTPDKEEARADIENVLQTDKCYILASHAPAERINPLLDAAKSEGNLEIVLNQHETPLYYYSKSLEGLKASADYEIVKQEEEGDTCYVTIRVYNTGESFINTEFDSVRLACKEREDIGTNLWGNLAPGAYYDMPMQFDWNGDTQVSVQLCNGERYWYEELGIAPITVTKGE